MLRLTNIALRNRRVLIRADLNVPIADGKITSTKRIDAAIGAIRHAMDAGAKVMVMSHLGRPKEGVYDADLSLTPVADYLGHALDCEVKLCADYLAHPPTPATGEVTVLENVRFNIGEKSNDRELARRYASLCDLFVMDAFATAHRSEASTCGVTHYAPEACAGPLLLAELDTLNNALGTDMERARRPVLAVIGGAKVSTKLGVLEALSARVDQLIPGGGIANTFIKAAGHNIGKSLHEPHLVADARHLMASSAARGCPIPLPDDVVTAKAFSADAEARVKPVHEIADDDLILDIGPAAVQRYAQMTENAGTILWNGPLGAFELAPFAAGTEALARAIAESAAYSIAGGGDTLAAIEKFHLSKKISCISTGGGAFLELLKGKTLPAVAALEARAHG